MSIYPLSSATTLHHGAASMLLHAGDPVLTSILREQHRYQQYLSDTWHAGLDQVTAAQALHEVYEELKISPRYYDPYQAARDRLYDRAMRAARMRWSWTRPPRLCIDGHAYHHRQRARKRRKR